MSWRFSAAINNRWTIATLLLGLGLTLFISLQIHSSNHQRIEQAAQLASEQVIEKVKSRIELYQYGLRGARGAVLTAGQDSLSRRLFLRYSSSRDTDIEFPGARGFGFIRLVKPDAVEDFVLAAQQDGWLSFQVKELAPNAGDRYIIQYIEPVVRNLQAVGLDIASEKNRRTAAKDAIDSGEVRLTGPITLVQAAGKQLQSFLILMPIYSTGSVPDSLEKRQARAYGWSYAPLLMAEVMADLALHAKDVHLDLYDVTDEKQPELFFDSHANQEGKDLIQDEVLVPAYDQINRFPVYGRLWESRFSVSERFIENLNLPQAGNFFALGVLISILSAALLGVARVSRNDRREVIAQQARVASIVESSSDGIVGTTLDGDITSWNQGAEKIFGFNKEEIIGSSIYQSLIPVDLYDAEIARFVKIRRGKEVSHFDTLIKTKNGHLLPVSVAISPVYDSRGQVIGASKFIRDISLQKAVETKIRELNTTLEKQVKERTQELQTLNLLLSDVLNASSEIAIIATDINGVITLFNLGAQRMLRYSDEEVIGHLTPLHFHLEDEMNAANERLSSELELSIEPGLETLFYYALHEESDSREWTYLDKNGTRIDVSVVITPMHDNQGKVIGFLNMALDISKQKKSNKRIVSMRDQLLMATNVAQLGSWTWDISTDILDWNDMMFQIYAYPMSLKMGVVTYQHWVERLHLEDRVRFEKILQDAILNRGKIDHMFRIVLPDQSIRYIQAKAYMELDRQGNVVAVTGINRDITQEYELESWLRKAKEEADAASLAKSEFLANMSHEIRTPMNAVLGMLNLVQRTALDAKQEDYIAKAHLSAKSLLGLLNDILDYSKIDAGKLDIESAPFEISQVIIELDTLLSGLAMGKKVNLYYHLDSDIPDFLLGDHLRLLQVLTNLSSNALKFTEQGSVDIRISKTSINDEFCTLEFSVTDTGIGIENEKREAIFEVFSQAESSTARRFGGSGLGLVICRRLVRLMGGELQLDSELGQGSHFYFSLTLPLADQAEVTMKTAAMAKIAQRTHSTELKGLRLLVVEDNVFNRQVAEELLVAEGATVVLAPGGGEGVSMLKELGPSAFDLVLMDMQMPNVDGLEATRQIRRDRRFNALPIVAMTANVSKADKHACLQAGMNDHISKPLDMEAMLNTILENVGRMKGAVSRDQAEPIEAINNGVLLGSELSSNRVEPIDSIMGRFAGNKSLYLSLVDNFLLESQSLLDQLEPCITQCDGPAAQQILHTLKGSTGTMGLDTLSNQIAEVEALLKLAGDESSIQKALVSADVAFYREQIPVDLESIVAGLDGGDGVEGV